MCAWNCCDALARTTHSPSIPLVFWFDKNEMISPNPLSLRWRARQHSLHSFQFKVEFRSCSQSTWVPQFHLNSFIAKMSSFWYNGLRPLSTAARWWCCCGKLGDWQTLPLNIVRGKYYNLMDEADRLPFRRICKCELYLERKLSTSNDVILSVYELRAALQPSGQMTCTCDEPIHSRLDATAKAAAL